jgi:hypothetical protein
MLAVKVISYPTTPDGRYFVVRGRLWRCSNPQLSEEDRQSLTTELMVARLAKSIAIRNGDSHDREQARQRIDAAKIPMGERGPVWWTDGAPDVTRRLAKNTAYAAWFAGVGYVDHG